MEESWRDVRRLAAPRWAARRICRRIYSPSVSRDPKGYLSASPLSLRRQLQGQGPLHIYIHKYIYIIYN